MNYTFLGNDPTVKEFAKNKLQHTRIWFNDGTYGEYDLDHVDYDVLCSIFPGYGIYWDNYPPPTKIKFGTKAEIIDIGDFFQRCTTLQEIYLPYTCQHFYQYDTFPGIPNGKLFCGCDSYDTILNEYFFNGLMASEIHLAIKKDQAQQIFYNHPIIIGRTCRIICQDGEFTIP